MRARNSSGSHKSAEACSGNRPVENAWRTLVDVGDPEGSDCALESTWRQY
jgi:hypothetical protein